MRFNREIALRFCIFHASVLVNTRTEQLRDMKTVSRKEGNPEWGHQSTRKVHYCTIPTSLAHISHFVDAFCTNRQFQTVHMALSKKSKLGYHISLKSSEQGALI